jgi:DNA-binding GntR family transcriptional regulator
MNQIGALRDIVKNHLLVQIQNGALEVGKTINLAQLSRDIGISATPIREALSQLAYAGVIKAVRNRGFVIAQLSEKEAKHLYETIAQLEVMALENSNFSADSMERLRRTLHLFDGEKDSGECLHLRFMFHKLLVQDCSNPILLQILDNLKLRLRFYEQGLIQDLSFYAEMNQQNEAILSAIEEDNVPTAALILKMNWMTVLEYVTRKMTSNETTRFR